MSPTVTADSQAASPLLVGQHPQGPAELPAARSSEQMRVQPLRATQGRRRTRTLLPCKLVPSRSQPHAISATGADHIQPGLPQGDRHSRIGVFIREERGSLIRMPHPSCDSSSSPHRRPPGRLRFRPGDRRRRLPKMKREIRKPEGMTNRAQEGKFHFPGRSGSSDAAIPQHKSPLRVARRA